MQDTLNAIILNAVQRALQDSCTEVCNPLPTTSVSLSETQSSTNASWHWLVPSPVAHAPWQALSCTQRSEGALQKPPVYINYVLCKWERGLGYSTDTYSMGTYPPTIAQYLVDYYLPTLHISSKNSYTYTKRVTISLRPRRYSNVIAGPTIADIGALILSKIEEDLSEHILTYLTLQGWLTDKQGIMIENT